MEVVIVVCILFRFTQVDDKVGRVCCVCVCMEGGILAYAKKSICMPPA